VNILVVGAAGFIGRHLVWRLFESGHAVTPSGTDPARLRRLFPGLPSTPADYHCDSANSWAPRLAGVDVVINAAGLIRETGGRSYRAVHTEGPIALFDACLAAGVGRVLQVSALGHGHQTAADGRIARRVGRAPAQVGKLERVGVDGRIPLVRQIFQRPDMIEVAMRQDDRCRPRLGPKAFSGRALDQALRAGQASIDQHPGPVASLAGAEEDHVDDAEAPIGEIRQHLVRLVVPRRIQRRLKSAGVGR
jgi:NAD(P)H-binding